jgi:amino acid transporter
VLVTPDLAIAQRSESPLHATLQLTLGTAGTIPVLAVAGVAVFACGLASMAAASRLLFAMARDRMYPASSWLAFVAPGHRTPRNAILFIWAFSSVVVLGLPSLDIITQISAVAGYLGYAGIVLAALRAPAGARDGFDLGRGRPWIAAAALVWVLGLVAALTVPPTPLAGIRSQHLPALSSGVAITAGIAIYLGLIRRRLLRGEAGPPLPSVRL